MVPSGMNLPPPPENLGKTINVPPGINVPPLNIYIKYHQNIEYLRLIDNVSLWLLKEIFETNKRTPSNKSVPPGKISENQ